jgi:hypothetical protein
MTALPLWPSRAPAEEGTALRHGPGPYRRRARGSGLGLRGPARDDPARYCRARPRAKAANEAENAFKRVPGLPRSGARQR